MICTNQPRVPIYSFELSLGINIQVSTLSSDSNFTVIGVSSLYTEPLSSEWEESLAFDLYCSRVSGKIRNIFYSIQ